MSYNIQEKSAEKSYCSKADSHMLNKDYRMAIKEYLLAMMLNKNNIDAIKGASNAYKKLKEYDKAIKHLKNARSIYGFDSEIYYELGLNYLLSDDNKNAMKNFMRTIKLNPQDKNAQIKLALTHELSGEDEMAILVYKTIIEKNPEYIPAMSSLANLYISNEQYALAINLYNRIVKINKDYYRAYLGIGLCFDKMGKYVNATRYYKKYISYKPNSETSKHLVSRIYYLHKYNTRSMSNGAGLRLITK